MAVKRQGALPSRGSALAHHRSELSRYQAFVVAGNGRWTFGKRLASSIDQLASHVGPNLLECSQLGNIAFHGMDVLMVHAT